MSLGKPCTHSNISRIPAFQNRCSGLPEGTAGPKWLLSPLDRSSCYCLRTKGFYKWLYKEGQRRGVVAWTPREPPPYFTAAPRRTAR